jgi:hypothetical protein
MLGSKSKPCAAEYAMPARERAHKVDKWLQRNAADNRMPFESAVNGRGRRLWNVECEVCDVALVITHVDALERHINGATHVAGLPTKKHPPPKSTHQEAPTKKHKVEAWLQELPAAAASIEEHPVRDDEALWGRVLPAALLARVLRAEAAAVDEAVILVFNGSHGDGDDAGDAIDATLELLNVQAAAVGNRHAAAAAAASGRADAPVHAPGADVFFVARGAAPGAAPVQRGDVVTLGAGEAHPVAGIVALGHDERLPLAQYIDHRYASHRQLDVRVDGPTGHVAVTHYGKNDTVVNGVRLSDTAPVDVPLLRPGGGDGGGGTEFRVVAVIRVRPHKRPSDPHILLVARCTATAARPGQLAKSAGTPSQATSAVARRDPPQLRWFEKALWRRVLAAALLARVLRAEAAAVDEAVTLVFDGSHADDADDGTAIDATLDMLNVQAAAVAMARPVPGLAEPRPNKRGRS